MDSVFRKQEPRSAVPFSEKSALGLEGGDDIHHWWLGARARSFGRLDRLRTAGTSDVMQHLIEFEEAHLRRLDALIAK